MRTVAPQDAEIPALGFGTARMDTDEERRQAVAAALETGYRHIDTAQSYGSESAVGDALDASAADPDEVFITTKLTNGNRNRDAVLESTRESRDRLGVETIDLLLMHSPNDEIPHEETLGAMNELRDDGVIDHVGVSNFSVDQLEEAIELSDAPVITNQVKYHARHRQDDLLAFCLEADVMLTAYSPLGVGDLLDEPTLTEIGDRHGKTPAQVAIRWLLQQPLVSTIPMSSSPDHIRENADVFDFSLSDAEMRQVFALEGDPDDRLAAELDI